MIYLTLPEYIREASIIFEEIAEMERELKEKKKRLSEIIKPADRVIRKEIAD